MPVRQRPMAHSRVPFVPVSRDIRQSGETRYQGYEGFRSLGLAFLRELMGSLRDLIVVGLLVRTRVSVPNTTRCVGAGAQDPLT